MHCASNNHDMRVHCESWQPFFGNFETMVIRWLKGLLSTPFACRFVANVALLWSFTFEQLRCVLHPLLTCSPSAVSAQVISIEPFCVPVASSRVPRTLHSRYSSKAPAIENSAISWIVSTRAVCTSMLSYTHHGYSDGFPFPLSATERCWRENLEQKRTKRNKPMKIMKNDCLLLLCLELMKKIKPVMYGCDEV